MWSAFPSVSRAVVALAPLALLLLLAVPAAAQVPVGHCVDAQNRSYTVLSNYRWVENVPPGYQPDHFGSRPDPSGMTFLQVQSNNPMFASYYVAWDGAIIQVTRAGWQVFGQCQFFGVNVQQPYANVYNPAAVRSGGYVQTGTRQVPVASSVVQQGQTYLRPLIASPETAAACGARATRADGQIDRNTLGECLADDMLGQRERAALDCVRNSESDVDAALCAVGALGGRNERRAAQSLADCYERYGDNLQAYPLCFAADNASSDTQRILACLEQQQRTGQITMTGTAICYGADALNMNAESQVMLECAATSGGEPYTFLGCAGGRLTANELDKCFTHGVGGPDGCFGPNNTIVQFLEGVGVNLSTHLSPNNDLVRTFNNAVSDLTRGPGRNHEATRVLRDVSNELERASQNVSDEAVRAVESISNVLPRVTIGW